MFSLTAGRSPYQEGSDLSMAVTVEIDGGALPLTAEMLTAVGEAFLAQHSLTGEVSNPRILQDGVTEDEDGGTPRAKGRVKVSSEAFEGDLWVRPSRSAKSGRRSRASLEAENAAFAALLIENGIALPNAA